MKKIILLALMAVMMVAGCSKEEIATAFKDTNTCIIDSCEYITTNIIGQSAGIIFIHKGNCRFCKERRQKELEELVTKLKKK